MDLYDTNSHKFVLLSYKLVYTNSHKLVSQERNWIMEVPLAQLFVALPLSVFLLCHPLVLRRWLPSPLLSPRTSPRCHCHHAAAKLWPPPLPLPLPPLRRLLVVVELLSAVQFCHCMPSCNRQHSCCRREHFCTNWYVLIRTTSILVINIDTRTNCTNSYKK